MIKRGYLKEVYRINQYRGMDVYTPWYIFRSKFAATMKLGELKVEYPHLQFTLGVQKLY